MTSAVPISLRAARLYEPPDYFRRLVKTEIFPDADAPLEVELGSGDGTFLVDLAAAHPERNFLGIERLLGRATKTIRKAARAGVGNVKVLRLEVAYAVGYLLPLGAVSRVHLLFPDPWPKKKQHKHRLVQPAFCSALHRLLEPGGEWLFKTDHEEYFEEATSVIHASGLFEACDWPEEAFVYPQTDFERLWRGEGRAIHQARFGRRG